MFAGFVMEAEVSLGTLELLADRVSHPLPPNVTQPHDEQNVEAAFAFFREAKAVAEKALSDKTIAAPPPPY